MADSEAADDEKDLAELRYKQEQKGTWSDSPTSPSRSRSSRSWPAASRPSGRASTTAARSPSRGAGRSSRLFILIIGFTMSELVSAYPTSGGIYWWASKLGGPAAGFFTGAEPDRPRAVTASVAYGCATSRADFQHVLRRRAARATAHAGVHHLRDHAGAGRGAEHLQRPPDGGHQQRLGVVARRRRGDHRADPRHRARPATSASATSSPSASTTPGYSDGVDGTPMLLVRSCVPFGLPAHAVHDHRLRRLGAPLRGDRGGVRRRRPRASGSRSSTPPSAAGSCFWRSSSRSPTMPTAIPHTRASVAAASPTSSPSRSATTWAALVLLISAVGQFFCTIACMTSASRMTFAFSVTAPSRARRLWSKRQARARCRPTR